MQKKHFIFSIEIFALIFLVVNCAGKKPKPFEVEQGKYLANLLKQVENKGFSSSLKEHNKGYSSLKERNYQQAEKYFSEALLKNPDSVYGLVGLALALSRMGKWDSAVLYFREGLKKGVPIALIETEYQEACFMAARAHYMSGQKALLEQKIDDADWQFRQALEFKSDFAPAARELGKLAFQKENYFDAIVFFLEYLKTNPNDSEILEKLFLAQVNAHNFIAAEKTIKKLQELGQPDEKIVSLTNILRQNQLQENKDFANAIAKISITRGDLAGILDHELDLSIFPILKQDKKVIIIDIDNHWAEQSILRILSRGLMQSFPNHTFMPFSPINRGDLAEILATCLKKAGSEPPRVSKLKFPDVPEVSYYYPSVLVMVNLQILTLQEDGNFGVYKPVSGEETLAAIRKLKSLLFKEK